MHQGFVLLDKAQQEYRERELSEGGRDGNENNVIKLDFYDIHYLFRR